MFSTVAMILETIGTFFIKPLNSGSLKTALSFSTLRLKIKVQEILETEMDKSLV